MTFQKFLFGTLTLALAVILAPQAKAALLAYEGFEGVADGALAAAAPTGTGFDGVWDTTNGDGADSKTEAAGLAYPASYMGTNTAVGGNGRVTGAPGKNAFLALDFDAATDAAVNSAPLVYISWLAQNVAVSTTDNGLLDDATRTLFNLAAEYPRNSGIRLNNNGSGSNSALGVIGNSGNWDGGGQSAYGDGELNPEVVDTWGAFNFNDVHNRFTGNGGTQAAAGSADYNPAPANYDGVDHLVLSIDTINTIYHLRVNPKPDGSSDGELYWQHTDGGVVPFVMKAFGLEAGNNSSDRAVGDMVVDEIRIANTFLDAAGFVEGSIPEPTSAVLMVCGLLGFGLRRRS